MDGQLLGPARLLFGTFWQSPAACPFVALCPGLGKQLPLYYLVSHPTA